MFGTSSSRIVFQPISIKTSEDKGGKGKGKGKGEEVKKKVGRPQGSGKKKGVSGEGEEKVGEMEVDGKDGEEEVRYPGVEKGGVEVEEEDEEDEDEAMEED